MAYDIQLIVQIDKSIRDYLDQIKAQDRESISAWVRGAIREKAGMPAPAIRSDIPEAP